MWFASKTATAAPELLRFALLTALLAAGCAAPPAAAPKAKPAAPEPTPAATPEPTPAPAPTPSPSDVVILDSGGEKEDSTRSLAEAGRAAREQRAHAAPPAHVITDKNLKQYAAKGQITVAAPARKAQTEAETGPVRDEPYWRSRALEVRLRWRKAADDVKELEQSAAGWRRRFYAENDPYVRSGQIKPEWDRVLDRLEEARAEVEASKTELAELLEEGRTAGALPGWLREGVDQEPKEEPEPKGPAEHKVIEPPKVEPPR